MDGIVINERKEMHGCILLGKDTEKLPWIFNPKLISEES